MTAAYLRYRESEDRLFSLCRFQLRSAFLAAADFHILSSGRDDSVLTVPIDAVAVAGEGVPAVVVDDVGLPFAMALRADDEDCGRRL